MPVTVAHVMTHNVIFAAPDHTIAHVRELMVGKKIHALPVVAQNRQVQGIVTTIDLAANLHDDTPVSDVMSEKVIRLSATKPVSEAARLMREHHVHHLVVADKDTVVGILSSYDLLKLIEEQKV